MPDREALLDDLQRVARELGHTPTTHEYNQHGEWSTTPFYNRWGSWADAVAAADLDPPTDGIPDHVLIEDIQRVAREVGSAPTQNEYVEHGSHAKDTLTARWGSFHAALRAADVLTPEGSTNWAILDDGEAQKEHSHR